MIKRLSHSVWIVLVPLVGCAPLGPAVGRPGADPMASAPEPEKTIVVAQLNTTKSFGPWDFGQVGGGGAALAEVHTVSLVTEDADGGLEPRLAARLPSFDDGTIAILPDGRMQTTWKLRPNVKWHDGAPFTADDVVFSWELARQPEFASSITSSALRQIASVDALDDLTVLVTRSSVYYDALQLGWRELWPFPKHLLAGQFEADRQAFMSLPYFTTEYVNLGPFKLMDFGLGEQQVFRRFDDYFLGRPRVSTIILRTIPNSNTLLANLKAGALDIASEKTLPSETALQLRSEWEASGEGTVVDRQDAWLHVSFQFDPRLARPLELSQDPRLRRGLFHGYDREAIRQFALPGLPNTSGDTLYAARDRRGRVAGEPYARYPYDPRIATETLATAGWQRRPDGRLVGADGREVQVQVKSEDERWAQEVALIADAWRRIGIDAVEYIPSRALARDREHRASFTGVTVRARGSGDGVFQGYDSRLQATAENRWQGGNLAHYANPGLDQLLDRLYVTLDEREQDGIRRDLLELVATDLPIAPVYFAVSFGVVRKGVVALRDDFAAPGGVARNAHRWDRQP